MLSVKVHLHPWHLRMDPVRNPVVKAAWEWYMLRTGRLPQLGFPTEEASCSGLSHSMHSSGLLALNAELCASVFWKSRVQVFSGTQRRFNA